MHLLGRINNSVLKERGVHNLFLRVYFYIDALCVCVYKRYRNNIVARFEVPAISMDLDAPPRETIPRELFLEINQKYKYDVGFR